MIVLDPALLAHRVPSADLAVGDRFGVRLGGLDRRGQRLLDLGFEVMPHETEVSAELGEAVTLGLEIAPGDDDSQHLRFSPLELGQEIRVETELDQRRATGLLGELGLDRLVSPWTEAALAVHANQDVGPSRPHAVLEPSLNDDVPAIAHRADGIVERGRTMPVDLDDAARRTRDVLDVRPLVLQAALLENFEHRVVGDRSPRQAVGSQPLERGEMAAREEVGEIGGEEERLVASKIHFVPNAPTTAAGDVLQANEPSAVVARSAGTRQRARQPG